MGAAAPPEGQLQSPSLREGQDLGNGWKCVREIQVEIREKFFPQRVLSTEQAP